MDKIDKAKLKKLIHRIGLKYNLRDSEIKELVESPYEFTKEAFIKLNFDDIKTEEELKELKTTFLYKSFGKLYISFALINRRNKQKQNKFKNK